MKLGCNCDFMWSCPGFSQISAFPLLPDLSHCLFDLYIHLKIFLVGFRLYPFKFAQVFPNYGKNKSSILERFAEQMELKKMLNEFLSGHWVYFMRGTRRVCIKDKQQVSQTWIKLSPTPKRKYWIKFMSGTGLNPCLGTWAVWFKKNGCKFVTDSK